MKECVNNYFIKKNKVVSSDEFDQEMVSEGKSIYEVVRIIEEKPLFLEEHLCRLENSCKLEGRQLLLSCEEIRNGFKELIKVNNISNGNVKLVFNYKKNSDNSLIYFIKHSYPQAEQYEKGVDTTLFFGERTNPNAKVINSSFRSQVEKVIKEKGVYEAILIDNEGFVTEGSKSNIFMVEGDKIVTSPLNMVLPGITRGVIIEIIKKSGIRFEERKVHYEDIPKLNGLFITGTSPKVLPIRTVDDNYFDSSKNKLVLEIMKEYDRACLK